MSYVTINIEIDPSDYIDGNDIAKQVAGNCLDMLDIGRVDAARAILANFIGDNARAIRADAAAATDAKIEALFMEWQSIPADARGPFWEWSHGKRQCS